VISFEIEPHYLQIAALALNVLSPGAYCGNRYEESECGVDPESNPGQAHPLSVRAPGGLPAGSSRA
jgi:hypothetical protein